MTTNGEETTSDRNVEIWKIKKLIKSLEMARGWVWRQRALLVPRRQRDPRDVPWTPSPAFGEPPSKVPTRNAFRENSSDVLSLYYTRNKTLLAQLPTGLYSFKRLLLVLKSDIFIHCSVKLLILSTILIKNVLLWVHGYAQNF